MKKMVFVSLFALILLNAVIPNSYGLSSNVKYEVVAEIHLVNNRAKFGVAEVNGTAFLLLSVPIDGSGLHKKVELFTSGDLKKWTHIGTSFKIPRGFRAIIRPTPLYANNTFHVWIDGIWKSRSGRDTLYFNSKTGFRNMIYQGIALEHNVIHELRRVSVITSIWFNETDKKFHGFAGGGEYTLGQWSYIFRVVGSSPLSFEIGDEPILSSQILDEKLLKWKIAYSYPPRGAWINETFFGTQVSCSRWRKPYNHEVDLVIFNHTRDFAPESFQSYPRNKPFFNTFGRVCDAQLLLFKNQVFAFLGKTNGKILIVRLRDLQNIRKTKTEFTVEDVQMWVRSHLKGRTRRRLDRRLVKIKRAMKNNNVRSFEKNMLKFFNLVDKLVVEKRISSETAEQLKKWGEKWKIN